VNEDAVREGHEEDRALLAAVAAGDRSAVQQLLDDVAPVVHGFLYARVGGDEEVAADLLQDTLLEAVRSAHTYRGEAALSTWMCTIARRRLARHYEAERRAEITRQGLSLVEDAGDTEAELAAQRDEVVRALGRLPVLHRQVGRSRVQVQSLLQRARDGLRRALVETS